MEELISEGVFSKNLFWESSKNEEGVYLAYERFENHLVASYLIESNSDLEQAFSPEGSLFYLIKDERSCFLHKELIEALSIQLPERTGKELYEFAPHIRDTYPVVESFVQSLLWRKLDTISEKLNGYVNTFVFPYKGTFDLFLGTLISVTAIPNHYFNGYSLHNNLMGYNLADRDAWWTKYLKHQYSDDTSVKRLIDWAWNENPKEHISDNSILLAAITIAWFHTSTNRKLRDSATKALICLLKERINVLIKVMKKFEGVNDPYIYERLFAVAYGCALRTKQRDLLPDLCQYIYKTIFKKDGEIYPHILLRDYARGVIEFTLQLSYDLEIDVNKIRPPYKSSFPETLPSNEEIDSKYKLDYESEDFKDYYWAQNNILNSMTTEYGRGTGGYGDFGRYVFQSALSSWDVYENLLSNLAIKWIFEKYGYDLEKHGVFDRELGSGRTHKDNFQERIGKKYQWLAFYEILARVSDNFPKYEEWSFRKEKLEPYEGPWNPYIRDIDPTITITHTGSFNNTEEASYWWTRENHANWGLEDQEWISELDDLPKISNLIGVVDDSGQEWLVLEGHPEWEEPKNLGDDRWELPYKLLWIQIRSYLVENQEYEKFKSWAENQDFMGSWMPENQENYKVFSREYYWSPAYHFFKSEDANPDWRDVEDKDSDETIAKVIVTSESYFWEEGFDNSKEETLSFLKPYLDIYENLGLSYSDREGKFIDKNGVVICFDPSVYHNCKSFLLIKKEELLKYLEKNDLQIIWTVIGEKNIVGGRSDKPVGRLEISGAYYLTNKALYGKVNTKIT